jgi:hypothetical protein
MFCLMSFSTLFWEGFLHNLSPFEDPLGVHLALPARPLGHFWLQMAPLGVSLGHFGGSLGPFGGSHGPLRVDLGVLADFSHQNGPKMVQHVSKMFENSCVFLASLPPLRPPPPFPCNLLSTL